MEKSPIGQSGNKPAAGNRPLLRGRTVRLLTSGLAGIAFGVLTLQSGLVPADLPVPTGWAATAAASAAAAVCALLLGLRGMWPLGAALAPPAAALVLLADLPGWLFPVGIAILAGLFWNVRSERVPLYLTNRATQMALADIVQDIPGADRGRIVDLGCGFGQTAFALARRFPGAAVTGVETAPLVFAIAWLAGKLAGPPNAAIACRNLWREDLSRYDAVYCFLSTEPMARLLGKARQEMRPGTALISNSFTDPENSADEVVFVGDSRETQLHIWRF